MVEIRFKPANIGIVPDGSVTNVKVAVGADIDQAKIANLPVDLTAKVNTGPLSGDKKVLAIGWDSATEEVIVDHEA